MKQSNTFKLTIATVDTMLFNSDAVSVTLPGSEGELTILAHHEPLITILKRGAITVRDGGEQKVFAIEKGLLETSNNQVTVLV